MQEEELDSGADASDADLELELELELEGGVPAKTDSTAVPNGK